MQKHDHAPHSLIAIVWVLTHCFFLSVLSAMVRILSESFHVFEIVFFHSLFAFLFFAPYLLWSKGKAFVKTKILPLHLIRGLLGAISMSMFFYGLSQIPLTDARAIALAGPLVASLFAVIFLKEKIGLHRSLALIIGFVGANIILQPGMAGFSLASLWVVGAILLWSVITMIIKVMGKIDDPKIQLFYLSMFMTIFSVPGAVYFWTMPESWWQWGWLAATGIIFLINTFSISNALKFGNVTVIAPFDFSGMIFTAAIAYWAFNEVIDTPTIIGAIVIFCSVVYMTQREARKAKQAVTKPLESEV